MRSAVLFSASSAVLPLKLIVKLSITAIQVESRQRKDNVCFQPEQNELIIWSQLPPG